jgi:hypothetical protein
MAASAGALLHFVPAASGAAASSGAGPPSEGRDWRGFKTMEAGMRIYSIIELMRLTRLELTRLRLRITTLLWDLPEGSPEREIALTNLRNISQVLARNDCSP